MVGPSRKRRSPASPTGTSVPHRAEPGQTSAGVSEPVPRSEVREPLRVGPSRKRRSPAAKKHGSSRPTNDHHPPASIERFEAAGLRDAPRSRSIVSALLDWYAKHRRTLPWRERPEPYAVWVSEIMLQQTQVATVIPYFERWMRAFPTIADLAAAHLDQVLAAWQGLGYYSRARNLHRAARLVVDENAGRLPSDVDGLRRLPGIGHYTAGAIASIAFEHPEPAIDGNVERVVTRVQALRGDPKSAPTAQQILKAVAAWLQFANPRRFNQALMELGALVCTPENPQCATCPLLSLCSGQRAQLISQLPETRSRPKVQARNVVVLLSRHEDGLYVVRQPETARHWATLFTLPYLEYESPRSALDAAQELLKSLDPRASLSNPRSIARLHYPITRFRFEARVFEAPRLRAPRTASAGSYVKADQLLELAMPAPHRRILSSLESLGRGSSRSRQRSAP